LSSREESIEFRKNARPGQDTYSGPILNAVFKEIMMIATSKTGSGSTEISDSESSDEHAGVLTTDDGEDGVDHVFQF
jgi:hypothetical protein